MAEGRELLRPVAAARERHGAEAHGEGPGVARAVHRDELRGQIREARSPGGVPVTTSSSASRARTEDDVRPARGTSSRPTGLDWVGLFTSSARRTAPHRPSWTTRSPRASPRSVAPASPRLRSSWPMRPRPRSWGRELEVTVQEVVRGEDGAVVLTSARSLPRSTPRPTGRSSGRHRRHLTRRPARWAYGHGTCRRHGGCRPGGGARVLTRSRGGT